MKRLRRTPAFRGQDGEVVPGSIAEVAYRQLGGVDQWVMIRGESAANPPMIFPTRWAWLGRNPVLSSLQRIARNLLHDRLLGSARRWHVVRPLDLRIVHDG